MNFVIRGFVSQSLKTIMDPLDRVRRWKRSVDVNVSFRKSVIFALIAFAFLMYLGPSLFSWFFSNNRSSNFDRLSECLDEKLIQLQSKDLETLSAHASPNAQQQDEDDYLPYVGNGYFGIAVNNPGATFQIKGQGFHLAAKVPFAPLVMVNPTDGDSLLRKSGNVVNYIKGLVYTLDCYPEGSASHDVSQRIYAHRKLPQILVQEIYISNPSGSGKYYNLRRVGASNWTSAKTSVHKLVEGSTTKYTIVSGKVDTSGEDERWGGDKKQSTVIIASPEISEHVFVPPRQSHSLTFLTAIVYPSKDNLFPVQNYPGDGDDGDDDDDREKLITEAALKAVSMASKMTARELGRCHMEVWSLLWTTGFGISHSMAENAINGRHINATLYYVLSQSPTPLHSILLYPSNPATPDKKTELLSHLTDLEGCYGSLPTLHETKNLWKSLGSLREVNNVVRFWFLNLDANGCHNLIKAGADGVIQAMVLSFVGLRYRQHHLEMGINPKDLHRDMFLRRVSYGTATRLNISVLVQEDNKPVLEVILDRGDKDYYGCDAGCLDTPVKISSRGAPTRFPVKLTDPVTAVLYITPDHLHIQELKHTIHVKEVVYAPAHEHHVIALHKHGNKWGGLPPFFWLSIGFFIFVFHVFLLKIIWQEYCAGGGQDKYRFRKFSDY